MCLTHYIFLNTFSSILLLLLLFFIPLHDFSANKNDNQYLLVIIIDFLTDSYF